MLPSDLTSQTGTRSVGTTTGSKPAARHAVMAMVSRPASPANSHIGDAAARSRGDSTRPAPNACAPRGLPFSMQARPVDGSQNASDPGATRSAAEAPLTSHHSRLMKSSDPNIITRSPIGTRSSAACHLNDTGLLGTTVNVTPNSSQSAMFSVSPSEHAAYIRPMGAVCWSHAREIAGRP